VRLHEQQFLTRVVERDDGVGVAVGCGGDADGVDAEGVFEVGLVPVFDGTPFTGSAADDEGSVGVDVAEEF
jgi:hypothetical protein